MLYSFNQYKNNTKKTAMKKLIHFDYYFISLDYSNEDKVLVKGINSV